ncbi:FmdB family zinc ribbon protein [Verminephrobacter aporrectodeae]|uniref:FmdB family zinc ribbon protein n=1 Tax=Verminephrobacter aporrectodeae TaxID=1110389 RepID=UPI0002375B1C|nr:FmdB family zinc ribbon protein [Verminephrobacter aporrectodeae]
MPIYAYKCGSCGHAKEVLQKISDAPLTDCPACGAPAFAKQVTAAGFQLKGSGWYVTDFRGGGTAQAKTDGKSDEKTDTKSGAKSDAAAPASPDAAPKAATNAGAAGGTGSSAPPATSA